MLLQCIDSLVQKVQSGVVINFEKFGADPPPVESGGSGGRDDEISDELGLTNLGNNIDMKMDGYIDLCDGDKNGVS